MKPTNYGGPLGQNTTLKENFISNCLKNPDNEMVLSRISTF